jgi:hypothetical protein
MRCPTDEVDCGGGPRGWSFGGSSMIYIRQYVVWYIRQYNVYALLMYFDIHVLTNMEHNI